MRKLLQSLFVLMFVAITALAQNRTISGTITSSEDKQPLPGVSVKIKGSNIGVSSNSKGAFTITMPAGQNVLVFTFIGFNTTTREITNSNVINVAMAPDPTQLNEVVISNTYITKRKGAETGSVSLIDGDKVASRPSGNMLHNLQGQVPGVVVAAGSGRPGAAPQIFIRGQGSINSSLAPLYVVDGQPVDASDFAQLNPEDMDSFNVLKDASATAIYGSRGANGVILVTTKRGIKSGTDINYQAYYGYEQINNQKFKMMNTQQRLDYEVAIGRRAANDPAIPELLKSDFNQVDEVFQKPETQSHSLSIRTGNEKTQAFFSGEYAQQNGIYFDSKWERYGARVTVDHKAKNWLKMGISLYAGNTNERQPNETRNSTANTGMMAYLLLPYEDIRDADGNFKQRLQYGGYAGAYNNLWVRANDYQHTDYQNLKLLGNTYLEADVTKDIKFRTSYGANYTSYYGGGYNAPLIAAADNGNANRYYSSWMDGIQRNTLNYNHTFGDHSLAAVIGTEYNFHNDIVFSATAKNTSSPLLLEFGSFQTPSATSGSLNKYRMFSALANVNYGYKDKYYVDLSIRRDGSSKFGRNNRWGTFWAAGLGWNIKKEAFLADVSWLSQAKLRGSIGTTGNDGIGYYPSYDLFGSTTYNGAAGLTPTQAGNADLSWEIKRKFNVGFDVAFLKNRLTLSADFYNDVTYDMVLNVPVSYLTGYSSIYQNMGRMYNRGVELGLGAQIVKSKDISLNFNTNFTYNKNRVTELYGFRDELLGTGTGVYTAVGYMTGQFKYNRFSHIDGQTGNEVYLDKNGNETTNFDGGDAVVLDGKGYYAPYNGAASLDFSYKGFGVFMQWNYVVGKYTINNTKAWMAWNNASWSNYNRVADLYDRMWKKPGDNDAKYGKYGTGTNFDDRYVENASYLRLRDLTVYYNFNKSLLNKTKFFSKARVYARANNLVTITKYSGYDPEFFNNLELGIYPVSQKFTFGVDVTF